MSTHEKAPDGAARSFQSEWPDLSRALYRVLTGGGVQRPLAEDVVQETGIRLLTRWAELDHSASLMPLALTIARNQVVDHHRKHGRVELQAFPEGERASVDVEQRALARVHLGAVQKSLQKMNPRYRRLLLVQAGFLDAEDDSSPAVRTARARARKGLNLIVERLPDAAWVFVGPLHGLSRRSATRMRQLLGRGEWAMLSHAAAGLGLFVASLASPHAMGRDAHADSVPPRMSISGFARNDSRAVDDGATPVATEGAGTSRSERSAAKDVAPARTGGSQGSGSPFLPPVAQSKGRGSGQGHTGLDGIDESGAGSGTIAGEPAEWHYHVRYRNPECVDAAASGDPTLACEATPQARARGSFRYGPNETSFDTSDV